VSRRFVWKHIDEIKENRVALLTTHAMEEADLLADSVAISVLEVCWCLSKVRRNHRTIFVRSSAHRLSLFVSGDAQGSAGCLRYAA
jgi:ABC-type multidrug transport system ATPase subunit